MSKSKDKVEAALAGIASGSFPVLAATTPTPAKRTRKPRQSSELVARLKAELAEAKALEKLIAPISKLTAFGVKECEAMLARRQATLDEVLKD